MPSRPSEPPATLDAMLRLFDLALYELQAFDPAHPAFDAQRSLLVVASTFTAARPLLAERYPRATVVRALIDGRVIEAPIEQLPDAAAAWLLPPLPPEADRRSLAGLRGVMERLFGPDGCPWDREQTHESLRRYFLEESYELIDAIDRGDAAGLEEELGDVFAHLFMQTAIAQLAGTFRLEDVVEHASAKFVGRHPHVFGDEAVASREALLERWDEIKAAERAARGEDDAAEGALGSVPRAAPSLQRAQALIHRARRTEPVAATPMELGAVAARFEDEPSTATLGELLWAIIELADTAEIDGEETLRLAAGAFVERFADRSRARAAAEHPAER